MARCRRRNKDNLLGRAAVDGNGSSTHGLVAVAAVAKEAPSLTEVLQGDAPAVSPGRPDEAASAAHLATLVRALSHPVCVHWAGVISSLPQR